MRIIKLREKILNIQNQLTNFFTYNVQLNKNRLNTLIRVIATIKSESLLICKCNARLISKLKIIALEIVQKSK